MFYHDLEFLNFQITMDNVASFHWDRNSPLHFNLQLFKLRSSHPFSIRLFKHPIRFSRTFFPTSNLCLLRKFIFDSLALLFSWKFNCTNSSSQSSHFISLYIIIACLYMQIFAGRALFAWFGVCIHYCVTWQTIPYCISRGKFQALALREF